MLEITKTTQIRGESKIGEVSVKIFEATINTVSPEEMTLNNYVVNYPLYKLNRAAIAVDQAEFEDAAYLFQEQLITEQSVE